MSSSSASTPANSSHSGKSEPEQNPRAPHDITLSRLANGNAGNSHPHNSNGSAEGGSNLSASAKEFVPKSAKEPTDLSYIPSLKKTSALSASAKEFVPRYPTVSDEHSSLYRSLNRSLQQLQDDTKDLSQYSSFAQLSLCPAHLSSSNSWRENPVDSFKTAIFHLRTHPGNLNDYMKPVADLFKMKNINDYQLSEIVEILFEESITVPNFRYTGARICKYLSQLERIGIEFRNVLLKRCQKEHSQKEVLISNEKTIPRLCGFSLFLAELFLLLEVQTTGVVEKYATLRSALHSLLDLLLRTSDNQTVKCATQLLKLAGAAIEDTQFLESKPQTSFDNIYELLSELKESPKLNKSSHMLINSVLNLKAKNFDRVEPATQPNVSASPAAAAVPQPAAPVPQPAAAVPQPAAAPVPQPAAAATQSRAAATTTPAADLTNEPVFFNEKGQQISRVEAGYSQEDELDEADLEGSDDVCEDEGEQSFTENVNVMDDEMMRCYEEFLRDTEK